MASKLGLPVSSLLLAMRGMSRCDSVRTVSHIEKIAILQTLKNKIDEMTDMIDSDEYPSLSSESLFVVTPMHYVCYLYEKNKSGSSVNELQYS